MEEYVKAKAKWNGLKELRQDGNVKMKDLVAALDDADRNLFYGIRRIFDEWDPLDLWWTGCPPDEYSSEAWIVFECLNEISEIDQIDEGFFDCFFHSHRVQDKARALYPAVKEKINQLYIKR